MTDLSPLTAALAAAGLAESWHRWCDAGRDWAAEAHGTYEQDSLLTPTGGFAPLDLREVMAAYAAAGALVAKGSRFPSTRHRSFTVEVAVGSVTCDLAVQLGRGLNSLECNLVVLADGEQVDDPELLHSAARAVLRSRGEPDPDPSNPYPRPVIGSRSQLEVVAREMVDMLTHVARHWG